jgi:hypothetical protein
MSLIDGRVVSEGPSNGIRTSITILTRGNHLVQGEFVVMDDTCMAELEARAVQAANGNPEPIQGN